MDNDKKPKKKFNIGNILIIFVALLFVFGIAYSVNGCSAKSEELSQNEAFELITNDKDAIKEIYAVPTKDSNYGETYTFYIKMNDSKKNESYYCIIANGDQYNKFVDIVLTNNISYEYRPGSTVNWASLIIYGIMGVGLLFLIITIAKAAKSGGNAMGSTMEFTKSKAKLSKDTKTTFKDVAGLEEEKEELKEIVDFLKNPKKYQEMGARIPKGVLLFGDPGTGKTLLARAVAGEAGVPFFYTTGSDLVEMYVGVGASRVRDMFNNAKKHAPSILFMDEIDAIGRQRGTGLGGGNDEREQTLNQLLVEMDGFGTNEGVIVLAATNRPDVLDKALLRPGRFDRQITVGAPDVKGREEILKVHARGKKISKDIDFKQVAIQTPGFTGADLENVMNEAALLAARYNKTEITMDLISEAIDRVMMGPAKKSRVISKKEKEIIAYHEAGHCVIGTVLSNADIVQKVTIIPRGQAGGYNLMGPKDEEETILYSKNQLIERITGFLGGRTAEELIFGEVTTGASNDMVNATRIARAMVTEYGMSKLGPITYEQNSGYVFLGRDYSSNKNFSDKVAHEIDEEIRNIINDCHTNCAKVLNEHMEQLKAIAYYLIKTETLLKPDIDEIFETGHLKRVDDENNNLKNLGTEGDFSIHNEEAIDTNNIQDAPSDIQE